jgi:hypothetical protein
MSDQKESSEELRVVLEDASINRLFGGDYAVIVVWKDGILHAATNDYGDGDDMGSGIDIADAIGLLHWLVADRFAQNWPRFAEYCETNDISVVLSPKSKQDRPDWQIVPITEGTDPVHSQRVQGNEVWVYEVPDWRRLVTYLIRDRCEGANAWVKIRAMLDQADIDGTPSWRGYV